jgi:hypothetical protein
VLKDVKIIIINKFSQYLRLKSAIEIPGGNRILVRNIIAQQIIRKRSIFKKHLVYKKTFIEY